MRRAAKLCTNDEGYLLLGLVVVCFLLILVLGIAAPRVAKQLERDREVESEHRAQEYVRAIQLYYRKNHRFPGSVDELLGSGTTGISSAVSVKYLRQQYKDPLTHDDYRLIKIGTAKTEVKGFFGEPLEGAPEGSLGSVAGMQSPSATASTGAGTSSGFSLGSSTSSTGSSATGPGAASSQSPTGATPTPGTAASGTASTFGSGNDATTFQGSKGAFLGVGSNAKGHGLVEWNGSEDIEDWEFLYDPRVELLKAKVSLFGGTPAASGTGSLGAAMGTGSTSIFAPSTGTTGTAPAGAATGDSNTPSSSH